MEIVVHSTKPLFQQKFQKKLNHFNRNSQFRKCYIKTIQLEIWRRTKKSDSDTQACQESNSDSTQKPPTPYESDTLLVTISMRYTTLRKVSIRAAPSPRGGCGALRPPKQGSKPPTFLPQELRSPHNVWAKCIKDAKTYIGLRMNGCLNNSENLLVRTTW